MENLFGILVKLFDLLHNRRHGRVSLSACKEGYTREGDRLKLYVRISNDGDAPVTVTALKFEVKPVFKRHAHVLAEVKARKRLLPGAVENVWTPWVALEEGTAFPNRFRLVVEIGSGECVHVMRLKLDDLRAAREGCDGPWAAEAIYAPRPVRGPFF